MMAKAKLLREKKSDMDSKDFKRGKVIKWKAVADDKGDDKKDKIWLR